MNKHTLPSALTLLLALGFGLVLFAGEVYPDDKKDAPKKEDRGEVFVQIATGKAKLSTSFRKAIQVKLGRDIAGIGKLHLIEMFGKVSVSGQVEVENKTDQKVYTAVSLIVFDKAGEPLGAVAQNMNMDPKESTTWGGFVIKLPAAQRKRIASYRYIWYEDTQVIGTR
jgi:hypothetical protein